MVTHSTTPNRSSTSTDYSSIDYLWFTVRFETLVDRLASLETAVTAIEEALQHAGTTQPPEPREFYSVAEFAALVGRNAYTVREWCRMERINAAKCESGRGDGMNWKISAAELQRYRDHGLLPITHLR